MKVNHLLEASAFALRKQDLSGALERAKEANKHEQALCRHREKHGLIDQVRESMHTAAFQHEWCVI